MAEGNFLVGIDIGSSSIKLCQLKEIRGKRTLVKFGYYPLPPQTIVDGHVMNAPAIVDGIAGNVEIVISGVPAMVPHIQSGRLRAIGISEEYDLQLFTRRLYEWRLADGSESYWNRLLGQARLADAVGSVDWVRAQVFA